jgi:hypothetical protein
MYPLCCTILAAGAPVFKAGVSVVIKAYQELYRYQVGEGGVVLHWYKAPNPHMYYYQVGGCPHQYAIYRLLAIPL